MLKQYRLGFIPVVLAACAAATPNRGESAPATKTMIPYAELLATPAPPADHREAYGAGPLQFGELRLPRNRSHVPIVVFIHGGCWRAAYDLAHAGSAAAALVNAGYAVWVPEYRRVGDDGGGWPGTFEDVGRAVDYVRELARRYPAIDTARVVLAGHSAGGQLALWAASRKAGERLAAPGANSVDPADTSPLRVAGVVSLAGITDLAAYASPTGCGSAVGPLLGGTAGQVPDRYRAVSPIDRVPLGIPVRLVHGASDPIVPLSQSRVLADRMKAAGEHVVITEVAGAGHFDLVAPQSAAWAAVMGAVQALAATHK